MNSWKELFLWLLTCNDNLEFEIQKVSDFYFITYNKNSYFEISKKMAKELQSRGVVVKE